MVKQNEGENRTKKKMTIYNNTWKGLYELAYDPDKADFGARGREAAVHLRDLARQAEYDPQLHKLAHSPLERAFFVTGESQTPSPRRFRVTLGPLAGLVYLLS